MESLKHFLFIRSKRGGGREEVRLRRGTNRGKKKSFVELECVRMEKMV